MIDNKNRYRKKEKQLELLTKLLNVNRDHKDQSNERAK